MRISLKGAFNFLCALFAVYVLLFIFNIFTPSFHQRINLKTDLNIDSLSQESVMKQRTQSATPSNSSTTTEELSSTVQQEDIPEEEAHELDRRLLQDMYFKINHKEAMLYGKFREKKGFLTIGIPSVKRKDVSYLETTLTSLVTHTLPHERDQVVIVVFLTDSNHTWVVNRAKEIHKQYKEHVESGFIQIVHPPHIAYPNFQYLERKFNDTMARVAWRSKQNLDYSYLMTYTRNMSKYYLQLEDDIITTSGYLSKIKAFVSHYLHKTWLFLRFSGLGFIGVLFKSSDLPKVAEFLLVLYDENPGDLLINDLRRIKGQTKEIRSRPSLFQHLGLVSSLQNKIQKIQDRDFPGYVKRNARKWRSGSKNPEAEIFTNMASYKNFHAEAAYYPENVDDYFWTTSPNNGSFYRIIFKHPQNITFLSIKSGHSKHPKDTVTSALISASSVVQTYGDKCLKRTKVGSFTKGEFSLNVTHQAISNNVRCISIDFYENQETWMILRDIMVKTSR